MLGSSQSSLDVDGHVTTSEGFSVLRRRSGGSAVVVAPDRQIWLDVFIPAGDPLFVHDVHVAPLAVGELWRTALLSVSDWPDEVSVHRERLIASRFSSKVCFAGVASGEVLVGDQKLVGCSQRRTREGSWFFTMAPIRFDPRLYGRLLRFDPSEQAALERELGSTVASIDLPVEQVCDALVGGLVELASKHR